MTASGLSAGRYLLGVVALVVLTGSLGYAAVVIRRRWLGVYQGAAARLAECVLAMALLIGLLELLGAVGLFRLGPIVVGAGLIPAACVRAAGRLPPGEARAAGRTRRQSILGALSLLAVIAVAAEWAGPTLDSYAHGIRTFDTLWYHLPWATSYAQTGSVLGLRFTDVEYLTAFYPAGAELVHGAGIVLMGGDVLSPLVNLGFLGLVLLGAWCCGRPFGLAPLTLLGGAVAMAMPMLLLSQAGSAANDVVGVAFLLAAVALVLNAPGALVLPAIATGLAISVKLSLLAPAAALTVAMLVWRRGRRPAARWLGPLVLAGAYWYVRNLIAVGNPLPWVSLPGLAMPAPPLQAHTGFSIVHYLGSPSAWSGVLEPSLASDLGGWWWAVLALALAGPLLCVVLPRRDPRLRLVGGVALASLVAYLITPETAAGPAGHPYGFGFNLRYSAPALTLSFVAVGLLPAANRVHLGAPRAPKWTRFALAAGLSAVLLATLAHGRWWHHAGGQLIVAGLVLVAAGLRIARPPRLAALAGLGVAALLVAVLGLPAQRAYFRHRYAYAPGVSSLSPMWARFRAVRDQRVGIVGTYGGFFAYPLYGLDGSNRVLYLADRGPHGSFTPITSCRAWRAAVNAAHLNLLVTTPARDPWHPHRLQPSPEGGWTASDPAAQILSTHRATGQPITLFALHGPLHPNRCG